MQRNTTFVANVGKGNAIAKARKEQDKGAKKVGGAKKAVAKKVGGKKKGK